MADSVLGRYAWRCAAIPALKVAARGKGSLHFAVLFKCRPPSDGNGKPTPSPVGEGWGEGKPAAMQKLKFALSEKALTLTLSHGRGDRFTANLKKQPAPPTQNKVQAAFKPSSKSSLHMISLARCVYSTVFAGS
ncbi:hypothetical protein [Kingella denitrificans]|uniref:hypothetical protein n=1 Tax=Kingella denitrificans TaxID=502 RepID=UPI0028D54A1C|nr:hypothetical protein [Kingella denitrificans]